MDDDIRRRLLQQGVNLTPTNPIGTIRVPEVIYGLNHVTGQVEARAALGRGAEFTFLGENSLPQPASRLSSGALDLSKGGPGIEVPRPPPPIDRVGAGVDFLKLDANSSPAPNTDVADKRRLTSNGAVVFG